MTGPHINQLATKHQPRQAAVGQLGPAATIDQVTTDLGTAGVESDRVYFLVGTEGADALDDSRGFLSVFDDVIEKPLAALRQGHTLVAVFGVDKDNAEAVRETLVSSGVTNPHYFGKWTYH